MFMKLLSLLIGLCISLVGVSQQNNKSQKQLVHFEFTNSEQRRAFAESWGSPTHPTSKQWETDKPIVITSNTFPIALQEVTPFLSLSCGWNESITSHQINTSIAIRFSADGQQWNNWQPLTVDEHSSNSQYQFVSQLLFTEKEHRFYQIQLTSNLALKGNILSHLMLNFFNPANGKKLTNGSPDVNTNSPLFAARTTACPCPQPAFVTRAGWNCPQGATSPSFTTVTHLIVHHSAGSNTSANWPAVVLSIWNSHVNTNGWADIGYNWLIDPNGVLYEGRGGGNNVVGAHFCGFNGATMGTCMLGTFTTQSLTDTAKKKLVEILAWKCCNSNLNPLSSAFHASSGLTINRISGHRDGCATECPGTMTYNDLPNIRTAVNTYINDRCSVTSVPDIAGVEGLTISPNPTNGRFVIALKMNTGKTFRYSLYDATGKIIYTSTPKPTGLLLNEPVTVLEKHPAGNYVLRIWIDKSDVTRNIVKQ
jgi:hypothetical protein